MNQELRITHWQKEMQKWQEIAGAGGLTAVVNAMDDRSKLTMGLAQILACMDGGTAVTSDMRYPAYRNAGAGILMGRTHDEAVRATIKLVRSHDIEAIADHEHCGAGAVKAKWLGLKPEKGDDLAAEHARSVAHEAGIEYITMPLKRPAELHPETCTYIPDMLFNPARLVNAAGNLLLPTGFVVSRIFGLEPTLHDVEMSAEIAFGAHGYGREMFSRENPFRLVPVAVNADRVAKLTAELMPICEKYDGYVAVEPLVLSL